VTTILIRYQKESITLILICNAHLFTAWPAEYQDWLFYLKKELLAFSMNNMLTFDSFVDNNIYN